jgi:anti-anti-sigma regulatory factor
MAATDLQLGGSLRARIERRDSGTLVALSGHLDESCNLAQLATLAGPIVIDLGELHRINSVGVRYWMDFVRAREKAGVALTFERCSPMMVGQITMIRGFMGARSRVKSFYIPYLCSACKLEYMHVLEVASGGAVQATLPCPKCKARMDIDDLAETYNDALRRT